MKPGVYTQLFIQLVFAVKNRKCQLEEPIKNDVFRYISGILTEKKQKSIIVGGCRDHIHVFFGLHHTTCISEVVEEIKKSSSIFINSNFRLNENFHWQNGYGAFSYSKSHVKNGYNYILNQEEHHKTKTFKSEYISMLEEYEIKYDNRFLFDFFEND
ncbi:MAG: transposase [Bacteroidetes bacterium GWF2_38_335]|nr:MAG: transposase [Bacteroidetes bacterium GWF2_38_335]OFY78848.1 MAG: transposase [Bacteroidetes bacterium RIFOXYA12_FULL_38_20]HBS86308.1 transposase [Bacteroidales bacterium]